MSRIGRQPIDLPAGVSVSLSPGRVMVNGPLGELSQQVPARMKVEQEDGSIVVTRPTERGEDRALHGLTRSLIANMVEGVTNGFSKRLELQGVGYRAAMRGEDLELAVGYSHPVVIKPRPAPRALQGQGHPLRGRVRPPEGRQASVMTVLTRSEARARRHRRVRPPEPYKGKGIRYAGEYVRRKVGKRA